MLLRQSGIGLAAKFGAVAATLVAMPLMLNLLGEQELGAWLVILSIFQWITMFDLGLSAGARNEVARAAAVGDALRVRQAVTTGWFYIAFIALTLFLIGSNILYFTLFSKWLGQRVFNGVNVSITLWIVVVGACINFALGFIQSIYAALEKASAFSMYSLLANAGFLMLLFLAYFRSVNNIETIALMYCISMICGNAWLILRFRKHFPHFMPDRNSFDNAIKGVIVQFGIRIFILQITSLIIFTTSRLLASAWLGPESVVILDAGFKIFLIVTMIHSLLMTTLWSSFTQAFECGEIEWIRETLFRLKFLMLPLIFVCVLLAASSPTVVRLWLGADQVGDTSLYVLLAVTTILSCWSNIFAYFLNGIGETRIQIISAIFSAAINFPATYLFTITLEMGLTGIVMGTLVSLLPFTILGP